MVGEMQPGTYDRYDSAHGRELFMENVILIFVLAAILGGAIAYIVRAKKRGVKCIGCPVGGTCGKKGGTCSRCHGGNGCGNTCEREK